MAPSYVPDTKFYVRSFTAAIWSIQLTRIAWPKWTTNSQKRDRQPREATPDRLSVKKEIGAAKTLLSKKKEPRRRGSRGLVNRQGSVTAAKGQLLLVRLPRCTATMQSSAAAIWSKLLTLHHPAQHHGEFCRTLITGRHSFVPTDRLFRQAIKAGGFSSQAIKAGGFSSTTTIAMREGKCLVLHSLSRQLVVLRRSLELPATITTRIGEHWCHAK
jgi:hypothetical protein